MLASALTVYGSEEFDNSKQSRFAFVSYDEKQTIAEEKLMRFVADAAGEPFGIIVGRGTEQGVNYQASEVPFLREITKWACVDPSVRIVYSYQGEKAEDPTRGESRSQYQNSSDLGAIEGWWPFPSVPKNVASAVVIDFGTLCHFGANHAEREGIVSARNREICALVGKEEMGPHFYDAQELFPKESNEILQRYAPILQAYEDKLTEARRVAIQKAYDVIIPGGLLVVPCDVWESDQEEEGKTAEEKATSYLAEILNVDTSNIAFHTWIDPEVKGKVDQWRGKGFTSNSPVLPDTLTNEQRDSQAFNMGLAYHEWSWFDIRKPTN